MKMEKQAAPAKEKPKPKVLHLKRDPVTRELTHVVPEYDGKPMDMGTMSDGGEMANEG